MHYFHNLLSASGGKGAQTPTGGPAGVLSSPDPYNLPTPGKILRAPMIGPIQMSPSVDDHKP